MDNKHIDADRLKAEIIRLRKERPFHDDASFLAYLHGLSKIEDFIDPHQLEQPCDTCTNDKGCVTCKDGELWEGEPADIDFEKEQERNLDFQCFAKEMDSVFALPASETTNTKDEPLNWEYAIARHFYELGKKSKEPVNEDLEKAARLYAIPHYMKDIDVNHIEEYPYDSGLEAAFKSGAEWQMKQDHDRCYQCEKNRDTVYWKGWNDCKAKML